MPTLLNVLLVDDNSDAIEMVAGELRAAGFNVKTAQDGSEGWAKFRAERPDLVISDIRMPRETGIDLLRRIRGVSDLPVILLTAHADVHIAVAALREGASDFVRFPDEAAEILARVRRLLPERGAAEPDDAAMRWMRGDARAMSDARARVRALARLDVPVLVSGEPGSGRLNAVRALYELSGTKAPRIEIGPVDREIPKRKSFAVLRELSQWSTDAQNHWAAVLREGGGAKFARVVAVAEPSLAALVDRLEFRRDIWARFSRFRLDVPPLRACAQDIPSFAREALLHAARSLGRNVSGFTPGALESLRKRPWPGNLPELREVMMQAVAYAQGPRIDRDDLDLAIETVIASREESLANRRAAKQSADRDELIKLLTECRGNVAEIARRLDMTRGAVSYRLRKHGLTR
jgi:DNA-binding NtrC family response regulator